MLLGVLAALLAVELKRHFPWPWWNPYIDKISLSDPALHVALRTIYYCLLFSSSWIFLVVLVAAGQRMLPRRRRARTKSGRLPPCVPANKRPELSLVLAERHDPNHVGLAVENPTWVEMQKRGLFTAILILGAIGSGKTQGAMAPWLDQLLGWAADDPDRRLAGLVLEVKGTFCRSVREMLVRHGRPDDYVEIRPGGPIVYNPLSMDLPAEALAAQICAVIDTNYGTEHEKWWMKTAGEAMKNIIEFVRYCNGGYVTLADIYDGMINPEAFKKQLVAEVEKLNKVTETLMVTAESFVMAPVTVNLEKQGFVLKDHEARRPFDEAIMQWLIDNGIEFTHERVERTEQDETLLGILKWFNGFWSVIEPRDRGLITSSTSQFLSLPAGNRDLRNTFCPPRNADNLFPGFAWAIKEGAVVALTFDMAADPNVARLFGTLAKLEFQRAVRSRLKQMAEDPHRYWRPVLWVADEFQQLVSLGKDGGDPAFLNLCREALCIPVCATQGLASLKLAFANNAAAVGTLLQAFVTKVFLHTEDVDTAEYAAKRCGEHEQLVESYSFGESGQDAHISLSGRRSVAAKSSISATKSYGAQLRKRFPPDVFLQLPNYAAVGVVYDGSTPRPAEVMYLKPAFLPADESWFEQRERKAI